MDQVGKVLVVAGLGAAALGGLVWLLSSALPGLRLGRLPGDIAIQREGFSLYFPITTMLLLSAFMTLLFWIVGLVRR